MKRIIAGLVIASMLAGAPAAFADRNRHGDGWNGQRHGQTWKNDGERRHGYAQTYRYPAGRHHENNDNRNNAPLYAIGALLLGGLITHAVQQSRNTAVTTTASAYPQPYPPVSSGGGRLLRDLEGRCYDVGTDSRGNEIRSELPPSACNW